uniref:Uncharacterized protein n=1 Tax=Brassica campestris TaxID=3711 RepID=A0A3P5Z5E7_BRACM|nr:unnamed protein product [Brassica rapa]
MCLTILVYALVIIVTCCSVCWESSWLFQTQLGLQMER